jgi:hypothetical protein
MLFVRYTTAPAGSGGVDVRCSITPPDRAINPTRKASLPPFRPRPAPAFPDNHNDCD